MALSAPLEIMPPADREPETFAPKTLVVRYGYLYCIGEFASEIDRTIVCGTKVILRSDRGTEIAEMLTTTCGNGSCGKAITREKMMDYIRSSGGSNYPFSEAGRVLRVATAQDLADQAKLDEQRKAHIKLARELVATHRLPMKIVQVEYMLGHERVMFYFTSESRVDFRALVRDLAHQVHTRIELRQVGARDEARLAADFEKCGQHCCCKQFLKVLTPISMRSAKVQKATLDPSKISGRCGRLMCCLRYEDQTYEELRKKLPKRNTRVKTEKGEGWVVDGQILTQLVMVLHDDNTREAIALESIQAFDLPKPKTPEGRTIQGPHDRPMEMRMAPPGRGDRGPGGPRREGPRPAAGAPGAAAPAGGAPVPEQPGVAGQPNLPRPAGGPKLPPRPQQQQQRGPRPPQQPQRGGRPNGPGGPRGQGGPPRPFGPQQGAQQNKPRLPVNSIVPAAPSSNEVPPPAVPPVPVAPLPVPESPPAVAPTPAPDSPPTA